MSYNFGQHPIRVIQIDGEPWWVLTDVCTAIGLADAGQAARRVEPDDIRKVLFSEVTPGLRDAPGGPVADFYVNAVNESGLYDLIFVSRKPEAKRFKKWVTKEVLPEIRRTGAYGVELDLPTALERYAKALREKDAASQRAIAAETYATELQPKVVEYETYMNSDGLCDLGALSQALGGGRSRFTKRLRELGILVSEAASQRGGTRPMQRYQELEWFEVKMETPNPYVGTVPVAYVTPRGVSGIFRALVKHGVGEHRWGALPTEDELFKRISFDND